MALLKTYSTQAFEGLKLLFHRFWLRKPRGLFEYVYDGYVSLVSHNLYPTIVNSVANYPPRICHCWVNVIFAIQSE